MGCKEKRNKQYFFYCQNGFLRIKTEVSREEKQRVYAVILEIGGE